MRSNHSIGHRLMAFVLLLSLLLQSCHKSATFPISIEEEAPTPGILDSEERPFTPQDSHSLVLFYD